MEDYKKKYEDAIERARKINNGEGVAAPSDWTLCETIFPELKESKEERVRKECISIIDAWDKACRLQGDCCEVAPECIAWLEKQAKQKPAWSKENSCYYDDICEILINLINSPTSNVNKDAIQKDLDWLMSIGESQLKSAWSEKDENMLQKALSTIRYALSIPAGKEDDPCFVGSSTITWLKSLKERYTWKPSEKQMNQLGWVAEQNKDNIIGKELMSFYQDLKKLREE